MKSSDQLKGKVRYFAKQKGLKPQEVIQMYFFKEF